MFSSPYSTVKDCGSGHCWSNPLFTPKCHGCVRTYQNTKRVVSEKIPYLDVTGIVYVCCRHWSIKPDLLLGDCCFYSQQLLLLCCLHSPVKMESKAVDNDVKAAAEPTADAFSEPRPELRLPPEEEAVGSNALILAAGNLEVLMKCFRRMTGTPRRVQQAEATGK